MLEVLDRTFNARRTLWKQDSVALSTPNILFLDLETSPVPDFGEALIRKSGRLRTIIAREGDGEGVRLPWLPKIPLSHLAFRGEGIVEEDDEVVSVRSPPDLIPDILKGLSRDIVSLEGAFELRRDARRLVRSIINLREAVGPSSLIYAPGIVDTSSLALLCYLGVDLFDSSLVVHQSARRRIVLPEMTIEAGEANWLVPDPSPQEVLRFNLEAIWKELQLVRWAICQRRLRELVELRVTSDPWAVSVLRLLDSEGYEYQEEMTPVVGRGIRCNSKQSLQRPDVGRWRRRIVERYHPPSHKKVLLLLPCSARKPYSASRTHKAFREVIDGVGKSHMIHEVILTSPLGVVPRELELFYPAAHYDIPVTGHWDCFERSMILDLIKHLIEFGYREVVCHMDEDFVREGIDCVHTSMGDPTSVQSLRELRENLDEICSDLTPVSRGEDRSRTMESVAIFQFGIDGGHLVQGAEVVGRYPRFKIMKEGRQLGLLSPERGMISLTLDGARKLHERAINLVQIGDFELKGNLFAVGVEEADHSIRVGDEAIIVRRGEVVGVGVASMSGREMVDLSRGEAVRVRHSC